MEATNGSGGFIAGTGPLFVGAFSVKDPGNVFPLFLAAGCAGNGSGAGGYILYNCMRPFDFPWRMRVPTRSNVP
eukprot:CAMPEP_0184437112 /NCGR_PEP_ID=MMETSP0738-20130409/577948_1 /TAXON_ID=385413 /ORGANISM="Thalassiosira miniscula, Strain CCMP1093" /LENGTH=73 /DNA_ID=CAMNT_0026804023 /DNA_START=272 /DNA_END=490 /DNA_ORIENTATION=+